MKEFKMNYNTLFEQSTLIVQSGDNIVFWGINKNGHTYVAIGSFDISNYRIRGRLYHNIFVNIDYYKVDNKNNLNQYYRNLKNNLNGDCAKDVTIKRIVYKNQYTKEQLKRGLLYARKIWFDR